MIFNFRNLNKINTEIDFSFVEVTLEIQDVFKAFNQSIQKSQFTMNLDQSGNFRNYSLKVERQFQGIISEMATLEFLKRTLIKKLKENFPDLEINLIRYDDVRTDGFRSPKGEFDIKLEIPSLNESKIFEIRSSKINHLFQMPKSQIIGKYANHFKQNEKLSDFYIKPLVLLKNKNDSLFESFQNNEAKLFISGGCFKNDMLEKSIISDLNQNGTKYNLLNIEKEHQIKYFLNNLYLNIHNTIIQHLENEKSLITIPTQSFYSYKI